ncbi:MAG: CotH kinase family protein, partial [Candidatus Marinimicrobia bacterium]|nr:CotH kinase family protein [Candidatus Neomarinimicrobiota bacterium]
MSSNFFLSFGITDESTYYGPTPGWFQPPADVPNLFINEFLSSNASSNLDPDFFSFCDWIEIYNSEDTVVNISGYYITDDLSDPLKFQFPDSSIIQPNSFLIVWADGEDYHPGNYITHTSHVEIEIVVTTCHSNFKLNKSGEEIGLFSPYLVLIDSITFEGQITDISYGRKPDGSSEWFYFSEPTPLDSNLTVGYGDSIRTLSPQFLPIGGFYSATQTIELASENTSATIRFTLDGSKPTVNSNIYTLPITINSTTVIRAQVFETGILPSLITTSTYFIDETSDLPVISIGIDPIYLWDDEIGIYTEGTNGTYLHGDWGSRPDVFGNYCQDWERPISMEYYSSEENLEYKVDAGIKIHGGTSRPSAQKSVTIHFRNKYGDNEINYQFFDDKPIQAWSSIMLRTGQDGGVTNFHDGMMHTLIANKVDADRQGYKPSVVFINGEYWGIHNIRERTNSHFIETNHNIDEDNVDMLGFKFGGFDYVIEGDMEDYNQLINFIESNDISLPENFNYVQTQVDINELLNYQILEIYASNWDWPQNNYKLWKPKSGNGKWRWILLDMDNGFNSWPGEYGCPDSCFIFNMVNHVFNYSQNPTWSKSFLHSLLSNPDYVNEFIQRFATHLNTIYNPERVIHVIDSLRSNRELETPQHIERWGWVSSMTEWEDNVEGMREFAIERPNYVRQHIIDYFNLDDTLELTVDISEPGVGIIQIHDINIQSFPDTGIYFQNIPVRIVAIPNEGYQFVNWQGNSGEISNSDSISVVLMGDSTITAVFEPTDNIPIVINEINYNSASDFDTDDWVELYNNSDSSINISDWQFKDSDDSNVFTIPSNTVLQDSGLLVLCKDTTSFKSLFPDVENYMGNFDFGLSGGGELIRLYDQQGQIV